VSLEDRVEVQRTPERNSKGPEVRSWGSGEEGEEQVQSWTKVRTVYNRAAVHQHNLSGLFKRNEPTYSSEDPARKDNVQ
jgi:hypothetical protein